MLLSTGERISCALCAMAIHDMGHEAISLTGSQAGIVTDSSHTKARIIDVRADRIREALERGPDRPRRRLPGRLDRQPRRHHARPRRLRHDRGRARRGARRRASARSTPTSPASSAPTRGSSPTPASCRSSPSRRCSRCRPRAPRCCSCARSSTRATTASAIHCRSSFEDGPGTLVVCREEQRRMEQPFVTAVTHSDGEARVTLTGVRDEPGVAGRIFSALADANVNVDVIIQNEPVGDDAARRPLVHRRPRRPADRDRHDRRARRRSARGSRTDERIGKVSIVGAGMRSPPRRRRQGLRGPRRGAGSTSR